MRHRGRFGYRARLAVATATAASLLTIGVAPAQAEQAAAIGPGNILMRFDTSSPSVVTTTAVTGLAPNQTIRGIDVRPATGQLYASTAVTGSVNNSVIQTYTIDPATGAATLVGQSAAALAGAGDVQTGYDFTPAVNSLGVVIDRMRYVNANDENARFNPNNGALAGNDTDLTPFATTSIVASAFDRNVSGTPGTTLFEINRATSNLAMQGGPSGGPSANIGGVTDLGPIGFTLNPAADAGFDISPSGAAFAAMTDNASGITSLYTFTLGSSTAATLVGAIGNGATQVYSLAIFQPDSDGDGIRDAADNCPSVANPGQEDLDGDHVGDSCDPDQDGDGLADAVETAIGANPRSTDSDGDGVGDGVDACPALAGSQSNGCPDIKLPDTRITKAPKKHASTAAALFRFRSTENGSRFACRLDRGPFKPCKSPRKYRGLARGGHAFEVRAIDRAGNLDPTPATRQWKVDQG